MFNLSAIYSALKLSNQKLSKNHKISPDTIPHKAKNTQKHQAQFFSKKSPFGISPVKTEHKVGTRWYRGPFRRFINTRFKKKKKKEGMLAV